MSKNPLSKTQIDRLGDRLKGGSHEEIDLRLLEDYRRSFGDAYQEVVRIIRERGQSPTGRLAKSTPSVVDKLKRESIRLSQIQDIAGCRIVVTDVIEQEQVVETLAAAFHGASVRDRREEPSYGYRAVHIVAEMFGKPIEIQVRTSLQHMWANLSEKSSDVLSPKIKYGGGPVKWRNFLDKGSQSVAAYEVLEKIHSEAVTAHEVFEKSHSKAVTAHEVFEKSHSKAVTAHEVLENAAAELLEHRLPEHKVQEIVEEMEASRLRIKDLAEKMEASRLRIKDLAEEVLSAWNETADLLNKAISWLDERKGEKQ